MSIIVCPKCKETVEIKINNDYCICNNCGEVVFLASKTILNIKS